MGKDGPDAKRARTDQMPPGGGKGKGMDQVKGNGKGMPEQQGNGKVMPPGAVPMPLMPAPMPIGPMGGPGPMTAPMTMTSKAGAMAPPNMAQPNMAQPQKIVAQMTLPPAPAPAPAPAPGKIVLLAPATRHITPQSSKPAAISEPNKKIALQFVSASKEVQAQMLRDPNVARAILQTLADNPGQAGGAVPAQMAAMLGGVPGAPQPPPQTMMMPGMAAQAPPMTMTAPAGGPPPAWTGVITLARNGGKKIPLRAALLQGKVADVEVVLRSAASSNNIVDITHRVPFEEVAKKVASGSVLSLVPNTMMEQASFEEYSKYFRTKQRAGVARLDGTLALYVLPYGGEDIPALRDSIYALGPHIPRQGCLLGLIGQGTAAVTGSAATGEKAAPAQAAPVEPPAPEKPAEPAAKVEEKAAPVADAPAEEGGMSSNELMDLFSNPDLIKLLSNEAGGDKEAN